MTNTIDIYLKLLQKEDRDIIKTIFSTLDTGNAGLLKQQQHLVKLSCERPYPLLHLLNNKRDLSRYQIGKIIAEALQQLLTHQNDEYTLSFLSFLANFPLDILEAASLRNKLLDSLSTSLLKDEVFFALLSRNDIKLLNEVQIRLTKEFWQNCSSHGLPSKEYVYYQALINGKHFLPLISRGLKKFHGIKDAAIRNNLIIFKLLQEFNEPKQPLTEIAEITKWLESFKIAESPQDLYEVHNFFYADFQRFNIILNFLRKHWAAYTKLTVGDLLKAEGVLKLIYDSDADVSFDEFRCVIEHLERFQRQIPAIRSTRDTELDAFAYYSALSAVYSIVNRTHDRPTKPLVTYYAKQMQQLNSILRHIRCLNLICNLLEDIFLLVFIRWEHIELQQVQYTHHRSKRSTPSNNLARTSEETDTDVVDVAGALKTQYHGFICNGRALYTIFSYLKNFVTKKLHSDDYKLASEAEQLRFQRIIGSISEALWKYTVLEKIDESLMQANARHKFQLDAEELILLVRTHLHTTEKSSSDDESRERSNYASLQRRNKTKKRRRATFCGETRPQCGVFVRKTSVTTHLNDVVTQFKTKNMFNRLMERSIIPQMLGTPESLATISLALKNFEDVKYIVETFKLQNTDLNRELNFLEQQQQYKQKLTTIFETFQTHETVEKSPNKPLSTVEKLKIVSAKGLEVSKFINIIDNFAQAHKIQQTEELKHLLIKHINSNPQYSFLTHFEEQNLNAVIIFDLILNLKLNRELISNVIMIIKRQNKCQTVHATSYTNKHMRQHFPPDIGVLPCLENLAECMLLLQQQDKSKNFHISLQDLLTNNFYSLKPRQLAMELNKETAFHALFDKPHAAIGRCSEIQEFAQLFHNLHSKVNYYKRFSAYIAHLAKLLKLRDNNLELHVSQLLKSDPCTVIGELLFECDMTPLEIEANVTALNLNLVHVIALNICPEIGGRCVDNTTTSINLKTTKTKQETILNYIKQQNRLLAVFLESIIKGKYFKLNEKDFSTEFMERCLELPETKQLAVLYAENEVIAALRADYLNMKHLKALPTKLIQLELLKLQIGIRSTELVAAQKAEIDCIITELIKTNPKNMYLAEFINDLALRAKMLQENFTKMTTTRLAEQLIESTLQHKRAIELIPNELRQQLKTSLIDIKVYSKVTETLNFESLPQAYDFGLKTPHLIFQKLLQMRCYKLCYKWCQVVKLVDRFAQMKNIFLGTLLEALLQLHDDDDEQYVYLLRILDTFPREDCVQFFDNNKDKFRSLLLLQHAIDFLLQHSKQTGHLDVFKRYGNSQISLKIFQHLTPLEREQFWHLFKYPLLIIEQLIMNAKFETLSKVLQAARKSLNEIGTATATSAATTKANVCEYCFDKRGHIYDVHTKTSNASHTPARKIQFHLGPNAETSVNSSHTAFILLNFNLYQQDHLITNECIDLLLRIYATKALDYYVSDQHSSSSERVSQLTDGQQSLDSLYGVFQMPKHAPKRTEWIKDDDATLCMCCRRAAFTIIMRRHHCRRCGRVVCFACSTHRMLIPELYANVEVRVCNDCHRIGEESQQKLSTTRSINVASERENANTKRTSPQLRGYLHMFKWVLSGNITHDKLLREEFSYDHAPSVALCLSILGHHLGQQKCVDLLLYHCRKLEKLIVPNPEVDYELVAKMMNCLALAAKVRGAPAEIESIREHSEIIMSVVQHGCESLIPPGTLNNHNLRKLADALVQAEKWQLALEVHLKCGFPTPGVMAAHGLACLRAGCFETAREKLSYCMPKLTNENANSAIQKFILQTNHEHKDNDTNDWSKNHDIPKVRRPQRGPPMLQEILNIIQTTVITKPQPETLKRASIIRSSNTSLASLMSRRKEPYSIPVHEPALNVLTTLANLKNITKGDYGLPSARSQCLNTFGFEESLHYLLSYGSHANILQYLMQQQRLTPALRYFLIQNLEPELFIQNIYLVCLKSGEVPKLIETMIEFDARLQIWQTVVLHTCRYLEKQNLLHSLYQLQLLLKDPVRASMTCVRFYTMNCENFQELYANAEHLHNAHKHLQSELETSNWEKMNMEQSKSSSSSNFLTAAFRTRRNSVSSRRSSNASMTNTFLMQLDARALNTHINTILLQLDVTKFLAKCERDYCQQAQELTTLKILKQLRMDSTKTTLPTLFENSAEKTQICILILYCGKNIDEGFGLAYRIIQDYKLPTIKVFAATAKYLARNQRLSEVENLINSITSNNGTDKRELDEILSVAINAATNSHEPEVKTALDNLVKKINSVELRISCHVFIGQLKSAYLLANKHERLNDIRKIMRQAEISNQIHIKRLCEKKLSMSTSMTSAASLGSQ